MPRVRAALKTVLCCFLVSVKVLRGSKRTRHSAYKVAVRAFVPLIIAGIASLVLVASALCGICHDLVVLVGAVGETVRRSVAGRTVLPGRDTDCSAVQLGSGAGKSSSESWGSMG